jgi:hypothetical protein
MRVVIAEDGEDCDEGVKGEERPGYGEDEGWEEPGGCVTVGGIEGAIDAQEVVESGHDFRLFVESGEYGRAIERTKM